MQNPTLGVQEVQQHDLFMHYIYSIKIFGLTLASSQATLNGVDQRVFALVAEGATEVIQVQRPHHSTSEVVFLQPVNL